MKVFSVGFLHFTAALIGTILLSDATAHASSAAITAGAQVILTATADGTAPFAYQWYKDGSALSGATDSTYTINSFQSSTAGTYNTVISNSAGSTTTDDAILTLAITNVAPLFTTQPSSQTATAGDSVSFTAAASGAPTPKFQWQKNGTSISGATNASFTLSNVAISDAGSYTAIATNSAGSTTSSTATLTVQAVPTSITTTGLSNGVINLAYATSLTASGGLTPYNWTITNGSLPVGLTLNTSTGAITGTPLASGTSSFTITLTDGSSPVQTISKALSLSIGAFLPANIWPGTAIPTLIDQGADSAVELGVKFTSDVAGTITGVRFYKSAANTGTHIGNLWSNTGTLLASATFSGETASGWQQVTFSSPVAITAGVVYVASYHCTGGHYSNDENYFASTSVNSAPLHPQASANGVYAYGSVSVFPSQTYNATNYWVDVVFQSNSVATLSSLAVTPASPSIIVGATQSFTATGTYSDGTTGNLTSQVTWSSSATARATITAVGAATGVSAGNTTISATLSGVSANTVLTINPTLIAPTIITQPSSQTVTAGNSTTFTAGASGTPAPTYQWSKNGINIVGATGASYSIANTTTTNSGTYAVVATNSAGSVTSNGAVLTVNISPAFTTQPSSQTVTAGGSVTFTAAASGTPTPTLQWMKNGSSISGATSSSYTLAIVGTGNAGSYTLVATNTAGSATSSAAVLTVNAATVAPTITTQPASQTVTTGSAATFTVSANGTPTPTYQWKKNGSSISGATSASYAIASTITGSAGTYTVVVTNSAGSVTSSSAILTINTSPAFTTQPSSQTAGPGNSVTFAAAASGSPSPTFQWKKNGSSISGATSTSYTISNVTTGNAGSYTVVATNSAGTATSNAATLTVNPTPAAPTFSIQPVDQSVIIGSSVTFISSASGTPTPTFQWMKEGVAIAGATSASYTISTTATTDAAAYAVVATNSVSSVTSNTATLSVLVAPKNVVVTLTVQ